MNRIMSIALILVSGLLCAEPLNPKSISSEAVWVAHLDLDLVKMPGSSVGAWLMEQSYKPEAVRKLNATQAALGVDVRNDISSLTVYGLTTSESQVAAMVSGVFDTPRLKKLLGGLENYCMTTNEGCVVHSWNKEDNPIEKHYAAFQGSNLVVFASDSQTLVHAVKVLDGKSENGCESTLMKIAGGKNILTAAFQNDEPLEWSKADMLKNADAGAFSIEETKGLLTLKLMLNARDEVQADNLYKIAEGLRAMALLSADNKPKAAEAAKNVVVDKHEKAVSLTLSCSSDEFANVLEESAAKKKNAQKRKPFK